jgi:hypothetical protein
MTKRPTELLNRAFDFLHNIDDVLIEVRDFNAHVTTLERAFPEDQCDDDFVNTHYAQIERVGQTLYGYFVNPSPCRCNMIRIPHTRAQVVSEGQWMIHDSEGSYRYNNIWEHQYWEEKTDVYFASFTPAATKNNAQVVDWEEAQGIPDSISRRKVSRAIIDHHLAGRRLQ